jgi:hypothetical protein
MRLLLITIGFLILTGGLAQAQDNPAARLFKARSLRCHFGPGIGTEWQGGKPKVRQVPNDQTVQFDSIDLRTKTARLIGTIAAADIEVVSSLVGITFVESNPGAFLATTVYAAFGAPEVFLAIDSRHGLLPGKAVAFAEQYTGTCRIRQ